MRARKKALIGIGPKLFIPLNHTMNNILLDNLPLLVLNQLVSLFYLITTALYGAHFFRDTLLEKKNYKQLVLVDLRYLENIMQTSINTIPDTQTVIFRLDVYIGSSFLQGLCEHQFH